MGRVASHLGWVVDGDDGVSEVIASGECVAGGWGKSCTRLAGSVAACSCPHSQVITAPVVPTPTKEQAALRSWEVVHGIQSVRRYSTSRRHGGRSCLLGHATD